MLLDFHLAHEVIEPGEEGPKWIGGTPTFMSPEQQVALADLQQQQPVSVKVDGRSDLYSLGLLLYEALGGPLPGSPRSRIVAQPAVPFQSVPHKRMEAGESVRSRGASRSAEGLPPQNWPRLNKCNPQVGAGVADIIAKCLAPNPQDRYPDAGALATDLWRHLSDLPLRGVSNRSPSERWQKWRRRRPHALAVFGMVILVLLAGLASVVLVLSHLGHRLDQGRTALAEGNRQLEEKQFDQAIHTFTRGLGQVENLPGPDDLAGELTSRLRQARRAQAARELHRLVDRFRLLYGVGFLPPKVASEIEDSCHEFWTKRLFILNQLTGGSASGQSPGSLAGGLDLQTGISGSDRSLAELEQDVQADLLDLAILYTGLLVRRASGNQSVAARRRALRVLDQAESMCGASAVLCYERQRQAEALGLEEMARAAARRRSELSPRTAWEHYALGRAFLDAHKLPEAESMLQKAVELQPHGLWPRFYQGICACRLGKYEDSVLAFTTCAVLAPDSAGCLYNRALAYQRWNRPERALHDYDAALQLDPHLGVAALNRGILHCQEKRYSHACADFERALESGVDPAVVHYNLALVHLAQEQRGNALSCLEFALQHQPSYKEARELYELLQTER
jgi:tetratricopeptide (TPR) repeat protein